MFQVEVDEEVFQFIKGHAEPLVDTFNSTLRRFLPISGMKGPSVSPFGDDDSRSNTSNLLHSLPKHTPQALRQILEIVHLVQKGHGRSDATRYVSRQHNIAPQTVIDKYTRQLNITASDFDKLLDQTNLVDLREILYRKFPQYSKLVDEICSHHA
jgi:negative regulator of replication initiation